MSVSLAQQELKGVDTTGSPEVNDIARFTDGNTLEGRSYAELRADINVEDGADVTDADNVAAAGAVMTETDPVFTSWDKDYDDLTNKPTLGTAAAEDVGAFAPALGVDDNYVTDAEKTVIGNTSGVNTGDQDLSDLATKSYVDDQIAAALAKAAVLGTL